MKILIIRFSSIGDIVLTTPVIRTVKTQLDAEVHFATKIQFKSILESNPYIDHLHFLNASLPDLIRDLRREKFDYILDLHNNLRTRIIKVALGVKSFSFKKLNLEKWFMVNFKINMLPPLHIVDRYLKPASYLGVKNDALGLDYFIPEKDDVPLEWLPESHHNGFIAYAIGGQHFTKKLPLDRMVALCEKINKPIVLLGGKEDAEQGNRLIEFVENNRKGAPIESRTSIFNGCGLYTLNQSASVLKKSRYVFTHDTGLMHIAAALKKEIYCIWGNTIPAFGMYPYRTRFTSLENTNLPCRPCSKIGFKECPKGHFKCMNELKFDFYLP